MIVLLITIFVLHLLSFFIGLIVGLSALIDYGESVDIICTKGIYKNTKLNMQTCRLLSILFNLFFGGYNMGVSSAAVIYWLTHKGRDEFGDYEEERRL